MRWGLAKPTGCIEKLLASLGSVGFALRKPSRIATFPEWDNPLVALLSYFKVAHERALHDFSMPPAHRNLYIQHNLIGNIQSIRGVFMKKAQGLPLNAIVIAALVLIVLVVLILVFTGRIGSFVGGVQNCGAQGGSCKASCDPKEAPLGGQTSCAVSTPACCIPTPTG